MKIRDICNRRVVTVEPEATLSAAAQLMRNEHVGSLVVVECGDGVLRPLGIVTDRDIVVAVLAVPGVQPEDIAVRELMTGQLVTAQESDDALSAVDVMSDHGVRRLPVVGADGSLFGIVTAEDLLRMISTELGSLASALHRAGEREVVERGSAVQAPLRATR